MSTLHNIKSIELRRNSINYMVPTIDKLQKDEDKKKMTVVSQHVVEELIKNGVDKDRVHEVTEIKFYPDNESQEVIGTINKFEDKVLDDTNESPSTTILSKETTGQLATEIATKIVEEKLIEEDSKIKVHKVSGIEFYDQPIEGQEPTVKGHIDEMINDTLPETQTDEDKKNVVVSQFIVEKLIKEQGCDCPEVPVLPVNPLSLTDNWNGLYKGVTIDEFASGKCVVIDDTYPFESICVPKTITIKSVDTEPEVINPIIGVRCLNPKVTSITAPFCSYFSNSPVDAGKQQIMTRGVTTPSGEVSIVCADFKGVRINPVNDLCITSVTGGSFSFNDVTIGSNKIKVELHGFKVLDVINYISDLCISKEITKVVPGSYHLTVPNGSQLESLDTTKFTRVTILDKRVLDMVTVGKTKIYTLSEHIPDYDFSYKHSSNILNDSIFKYTTRDTDETYGFEIKNDMISKITEDHPRYYIPTKYIDEKCIEHPLIRVPYTITDSNDQGKEADITFSDKNTKISLTTNRSGSLYYAPDFSQAVIKCPNMRLVLHDQSTHESLHCTPDTTATLAINEVVIGTSFFNGPLDKDKQYANFGSASTVYVPYSTEYTVEDIKKALMTTANVVMYDKYTKYTVSH